MISLRAEMRKLRIILALACSFAAFTHAAAQVKAPGRASGAVVGDCRACAEMVVIPAGSFTMGCSSPAATVAVPVHPSGTVCSSIYYMM
jgi:formylglycine-generating enzyme required for sulfatase activity